jgi:hypothetical protein
VSQFALITFWTEAGLHEMLAQLDLLLIMLVQVRAIIITQNALVSYPEFADYCFSLGVVLREVQALLESLHLVD